MKLKAPDGVAGPIFHRGASLDIEEDGSIEVPDCDYDALAGHGFKPWAEAEAVEIPIEAMSRGQLILRVIDMTTKTLHGLSTEELRARLLSLPKDATPLPDEADGAGVSINPAAMTTEEIGKMSRNELFAFLRAKKVVVSIPIRNDELRAIALDALSAPAVNIE